MKFYRHLAVRPFKLEHSQRLVLLLRGERVSAEISLVWLTNDHVKILGQINDQCAEWGKGLVEARLYYVNEVGGRIRWSG